MTPREAMTYGGRAPRLAEHSVAVLVGGVSTQHLTIIPGINQARDEFKNGDLIIDSRIAYQLNDIFRFGFVINNLLNREYMSRPANMMPPRTFALQCNIKL